MDIQISPFYRTPSPFSGHCPKKQRRKASFQFRFLANILIRLLFFSFLSPLRQRRRRAGTAFLGRHLTTPPTILPPPPPLMLLLLPLQLQLQPRRFQTRANRREFNCKLFHQLQPLQPTFSLFYFRKEHFWLLSLFFVLSFVFEKLVSYRAKNV